MLVLARRVGEGLRIRVTEPGEFEIIILKAEGNTVRVGFEAPKSVEILRDDAVYKNRKEP